MAVSSNQQLGPLTSVFFECVCVLWRTPSKSLPNYFVARLLMNALISAFLLPSLLAANSKLLSTLSPLFLLIYSTNIYEA